MDSWVLKLHCTGSLIHFSHNEHHGCRTTRRASVPCVLAHHSPTKQTCSRPHAHLENSGSAKLGRINVSAMPKYQHFCKGGVEKEVEGVVRLAPADGSDKHQQGSIWLGSH